jgi:uncharacterized protein YukE
MGPEQQRVDIPALNAVAGEVEQTAEMIGKARTDHVGQLAPPGALDGWQTAAALTNAMTGWDAFLGEMQKQVAEFGAGLRQSAADYQATDQAAADRVTRSGGGARPI